MYHLLVLLRFMGIKFDDVCEELTNRHMARLVPMVRVGIINYGVGNLGSLINAFRRVGSEPVIVNEPGEIMNVNAIVLPGVVPLMLPCLGLIDLRMR